MVDLYRVKLADKQNRLTEEVVCHWDPTYGALRIYRPVEDRRRSTTLDPGKIVPLSWFEEGRAEIEDTITLVDLIS